MLWLLQTHRICSAQKKPLWLGLMEKLLPSALFMVAKAATFLMLLSCSKHEYLQTDVVCKYSLNTSIYCAVISSHLSRYLIQGAGMEVTYAPRCPASAHAQQRRAPEPEHRAAAPPRGPTNATTPVPTGPLDLDPVHSYTKGSGEGRQAGLSGPEARLSVRQHTVRQSETEPQIEPSRSARNHPVGPKMWT